MVQTHTAGLSVPGAAFWLLCGLAAPAGAAEPVALPSATGVAYADAAVTPDGPLFDFDIPAQPLKAALAQYAYVSGRPALFPSEILGARISTAVEGRYSAEGALYRLLEGTGLIADKRSSELGQTFVLKESDVVPAAPRGGMAELFSEQGIAGLVQARVWQALCAHARTRPGSYTSLLRFHLEADGHVGGARLIGSSGDAGRDLALLEVLREVQIDRAPPAAIVQRALTMMVAPGDNAGGPRCASGQGAG